MHYWNQDNFEGLIDLASEFSSTPELSLLAVYCELREKGVRPKAFTALDQFIKNTLKLKTQEQRKIVLKILEADARTPSAHQFLTHPILTKLIFPVLSDWLTESPQSCEALRWLGLLKSELNYLEDALKLNPADSPVRRRLIIIELDYVDYATHHLDESILLFPIKNCRDSLKRVRELLLHQQTNQLFNDLSIECNRYTSILDDWELYNKSNHNCFPTWCEENDRTHQWITKVYYQ